MTFVGTDALGWQELLNKQMVEAVYLMYNTAIRGWFIPILFIVYMFMLYNKTQNFTLCWVIGLFFVSLYGASHFMNEISMYVTFLLLVFLLGGVLYMLIWK